VQAVPNEFEVTDDLRPEQVQHHCRGREPEPGHEFLGHTGAAENVTRLDDDDAQPGAREVAGGDEAVVPCAHDDHVGAARRTHRGASNTGAIASISIL
jgi:hypothetical protein